MKWLLAALSLGRDPFAGRIWLGCLIVLTIILFLVAFT